MFDYKLYVVYTVYYMFNYKMLKYKLYVYLVRIFINKRANT